ncbi:MAG: hypothetical protein IKS90_03490 [Clostridia bacterium]|nr:hypothetical protein [Clostridia bacterium]
MFRRKHKENKTVKQELNWWFKRLNCKDMKEYRRRCLKAIMLEMFDSKEYAQAVLDGLADN